MKGFLEDANYSIGILDEGMNIADVVDNYIYEHTLTGKNSFFIGDLGNLIKQHIHWQNVMAPIKPFYSLKCNSTLGVLEILSALGTGFACSNKTEMAMVQDLGVSPENIIFTSPCKQASQIKYAAKIGVNILTCDNELELKKIARNHSNAKLLLHIATEDINGDEEMTMKFGTTLKNCRHLMECAKELNVQIVGVKFHVSNPCMESQAYKDAISDARCVFDMAEEFGFTLNMLNIGGGFTDHELDLEEINRVIIPLLGTYFPEESGVTVIAEPGCYYVSSAFTLAVNIFAKKAVQSGDPFNKYATIYALNTVSFRFELPLYGEIALKDKCPWLKIQLTMLDDSVIENIQVEQTQNDEPVFIYYMNDGVYGSFGSKLSENLTTIPEVHKKYKEDEPLFASSLWGPSCDELDQIVESCLLPELNIGDWLLFDNMGSGSLGEQPAFNDFQRPPIYYVMSVRNWCEMQDAGFISDTLMKNFCFVPSCIQLSSEDGFSIAA